MNKDYWKAKVFSIGYRPSKKNKDLYWRNNETIIFFLDFANNKFERVTRNVFNFPLTFKQLKQLEEWELNRKLNEEKSRLAIVNFNVYHAKHIGEGVNVRVFTNREGYCKLCNKDLQKNTLLCKDCMEKQKPLFIEEAKHYLAKHINETDACFVCGKKLFCPVDNMIYNFCMENYSKYFLNSISEGYDLLERLNNHFNLYDEQNFLIKHHICYFDEFTIDVCPSCHQSIHKSKEECYKQYKPIDERIKIKSKYVLVNCAWCDGKARILRKEQEENKTGFFICSKH
jgi:hypothetical protein